jgi:hypothetical protein
MFATMSIIKRSRDVSCQYLVVDFSLVYNSVECVSENSWAHECASNLCDRTSCPYFGDPLDDFVMYASAH